MRTLHERIGGDPAIRVVVDDFYDRLVRDPRVLHHFESSRIEALKQAQCRWIAHSLGAEVDGPVPDLREAHKNLQITDDQVAAVVGHLDASLADASVDDQLRRQVMSLVSRLWFARLF